MTSPKSVAAGKPTPTPTAPTPTISPRGHNRNVKTSAVGAGHILHAEGDALTGDIITEILDAHAQAEFETDLAKRADFHGADAVNIVCTETFLTNAIRNHTDPTPTRPGGSPPIEYCETVSGAPVDP